MNPIGQSIPVIYLYLEDTTNRKEDTGGRCVCENTNSEYVLVGGRGRSDYYLCMSIVPVCTVYISILILKHVHFIPIVGVGKERRK